GTLDPGVGSRVVRDLHRGGAVGRPETPAGCLTSNWQCEHLLLRAILKANMTNAVDDAGLKSGEVDTALAREVAALTVSALNRDVAAEEIDPRSPLYQEGLGLDSLDILEVA